VLNPADYPSRGKELPPPRGRPPDWWGEWGPGCTARWEEEGFEMAADEDVWVDLLLAQGIEAEWEATEEGTCGSASSQRGR
jgi:hypothetical protein